MLSRRRIAVNAVELDGSRQCFGQNSWITGNPEVNCCTRAIRPMMSVMIP
jgi:hypothetical protein